MLVYSRYSTIYRLNYVPYNVISWDISIHKFIQSQKTETKTLLLEQYQKLSNVLLQRTILSNFPIEVKSKYKIFYESRWQEVIAKVYKTRIQILMISKWYFNCAALISITWRTKLASVGELCGRIYRQIHNKTNSWNIWHFRSGISFLLPWLAISIHKLNSKDVTITWDK